MGVHQDVARTDKRKPSGCYRGCLKGANAAKDCITDASAIQPKYTGPQRSDKPLNKGAGKWDRT